MSKKLHYFSNPRTGEIIDKFGEIKNLLTQTHDSLVVYVIEMDQEVKSILFHKRKMEREYHEKWSRMLNGESLSEADAEEKKRDMAMLVNLYHDQDKRIYEMISEMGRIFTTSKAAMQDLRNYMNRINPFYESTEWYHYTKIIDDKIYYGDVVLRYKATNLIERWHPERGVEHQNRWVFEEVEDDKDS